MDKLKNTYFEFSYSKAIGLVKVANISRIMEGKEICPNILESMLMIELPIGNNASEHFSLKLRVWKELITLTISLNKEASFPRGSFFFLDQSEDLCGAKTELD